MAGNVVVKINHAGIADLLKSEQVRAILAGHAQAVEAQAKAIAPVDTGAYRDSIHRESVTTDRAVERVVATAPHSHIVEARDGVLARAMNAAGGS